MSDNRIEAELAELAKLERNWNSYGALPITEYAMSEARRLLAGCTPEQRATCTLVPRSGGGIELTWDGERLAYLIPAASGGLWEVDIELPRAPDLGIFLGMMQSWPH